MRLIVLVASTALCPFSTPSLPLLLPLPLIAATMLLPLSVILDGIVRLRGDNGDKVFLLSVASHEDARSSEDPLLLPETARRGAAARWRASVVFYGRGLCVFRGTQAGPGRAGEQQQEQTSPNLERTILCTSVLFLPAALVEAGLEVTFQVDWLIRDNSPRRGR